jgi:hypothetical protein
MRLGAWLMRFGLASAVSGCSGGYPLPPTRCDEWCDATKGLSCADYYQPAGCVSQCERSKVGIVECSAELDAVVTCFRTTPRASMQLCSFDNQPNACAAQNTGLENCVSDHVLDEYNR